MAATEYYEKLLNNAFLNVVKNVLIDLKNENLKHYPALYLTFRTKNPKVKIPAHLKERFPNEMTIVLEHQFTGLEITDKQFSVTLSFSGKNENLTVPFSELISFNDINATFALTFTPNDDEKQEDKTNNVISFTDLKKNKK